MSHPLAPESVQQAIDHCVKCGLCLPECPTYGLASDENESPRGRLALIDGLMAGELAADRRLRRHLDNCLGCRRCERICPSQVRFGAIVDAAREQLGPERASGWVPGPRLQAIGSRLARRIPTALSRPYPGLNRLHRLARALPFSQAPPKPGHHPTPLAHSMGTVGLFTGCVTAAQQADALHAAVFLLNRTGFDVLVPEPGLCCGALELHSGDRSGARRRGRDNGAAFAGKVDAVISIASGCGIQLDASEPPLPVPHRDICALLLGQQSLDPSRLKPLHRVVMLHTPCTVENVYGGAHWAKQLLDRIPGIDLIPANEIGQCCGSAGDYMLRHPETAARLRQPILKRLRATPAAGIFLTTNIGCAMHIAEGLAAQDVRVEVLHPVELLARQWID